ncbi:MAG: helicase [Anaerolineae bacterium]|jgi:superfamily II DNA or RNA helicase|nr:MAG: helicase [Anaerolineae bacterium]
MKFGTVVKFREALWVLLPNEDPQVLLLRPLSGATESVQAVHRQLSDLLGYTLPSERIQAATFPLPTAQDVSSAASAHLLWQAARLSLREGASPLRSLGRISIRPRTYQFVPLLMALRLDPVRLLIADDVGVGKTIEALLIVRELWERGEIKRFAVLCPPYLCDQWKAEIEQKINLEAVIVRSGTIGQLERHKAAEKTVYEHYPVQVISIDWVKSERNRHAFLLHAPELVIVDEAHGATIAAQKARQERYELVKAVAQDAQRHLLLLTATPHSGVEHAFKTLLGLLNEKFSTWEMNALTESQRKELARHFVQRTRKDIETQWQGAGCFPRRQAQDQTYRLSSLYRKLFQHTYRFCAEIVRSGQSLRGRQQRVRYWGALALLRCVMSSPAAALAALQNREARLADVDEEFDFREFVFESSEDWTEDEQPTSPLEVANRQLEQHEKGQLRKLIGLAEALLQQEQDTKLQGLIEQVRALLQEGFHPIVWCRYVATAEYVADALQQALQPHLPDLQVICLTSREEDEVRRARIEAIDATQARVLVATDCLSEGINLQEKFTAVIHYDLPWNPNRLEQREGRVDRFGQTAPLVRVVRYYSPDNPIDGVVLRVLLDKAHQIYQTLGTHVPVPEESESVTEAVLNALFLRTGAAPEQLTLDLALPEVQNLHRRWERDAERERENRTRFAQRALKPAAVERELQAADAVLGDPEAVRLFVLEAAQRLGLTIEAEKPRSASNPPAHSINGTVYRLWVAPSALQGLPEALRYSLPQRKEGWWRVSFVSPTPQGAEYLGRNHPFVANLARFLFEEALAKGAQATAARCAVLLTQAVPQPTLLFLLRVRYLLLLPERPDQLSEEVRVLGLQRSQDGNDRWLDHQTALSLLLEAQPSGNLPLETKRQAIDLGLQAWQKYLKSQVQPLLDQRAAELAEAHKRLRQAVRLRVRELRLEAQKPPDLLGLMVLIPQANP